MNKVVLIALVFLCLPANYSFAHSPRLVGSETRIIVSAPELSKAYYAELKGSTATYVIIADKPFKLYVNVLVPDIKGIQKNISAKIIWDARVVATLDGKNFKWTSFYEEFGGDNYFKGPEYSKKVQAGDYQVLVYSPSNEGKYVLAIGEKEDLSPGALIKAVLDLPRIKMFFNRSPFTALFNKIGLFIGIGLVVFGPIILTFVRLLALVPKIQRKIN